MKGIKKKWLPAAFGLMAGMALSLPTEAVVVPIVSTNSNSITQIGDTTVGQSNYDEVGFKGDTVSPDLIPNLVSPETKITLGRVQFTVGDNCGGNACDTNTVQGNLQYTITALSQTKTVDLGFTWSNSPTGPVSSTRYGGTLVFTPLSSVPLIFTSGFESLIMTLITPGVFEVKTADAIPRFQDVEADVRLIIPEPSSLPRLGIGLLAFGLNRRSRAKATAL